MSEDDDRAAAQWSEALRWFAYVDQDLQAAELCAAAEPLLLGPGAYHCQQAAEKLIKGLLVAAATRFPKIHDIKSLAHRAAADYPELADAMMALADLTVWGLAYRYPAEEEDISDTPTVGRVREAIAQLQSLKTIAMALGPKNEPDRDGGE